MNRILTQQDRLKEIEIREYKLLKQLSKLAKNYNYILGGVYSEIFQQQN